ncbi:MAG: PGF-pre-PGF domain-containing protein, partial [Methanolobus sp.]|nr:PGF-pre-PGF domain-containing protein [Methanolobus sp.]
LVTLEEAPFPVYNINISDAVGGSANITTDKTTAQETDPVNITISDIEPGKQFKSINVTDSNNAPIALTEVSAGFEYNFTMPASNVTVLVTLEEASKGDGSSGGGGGGAPSGTGEKYENIDFKDFVLKPIVKDIESVFTFTNEDNSIVSVSFTSKLNGGQVKAVVEILKGTSSQVRSSAPGLVYRNMNIYVDSNLAPSVIGNSKIDFKVEKSWISYNEIDMATIGLYRYSGNSWVKLPAKVTGEDEYYYYFTSTTPGFSPFAISSVIEQVTEPVDESAISITEDADSLMSPADSITTEPVNTASQENNTGFPFMLIIGLVLLMVIGIFGYRNREYYDKVRMQIGNPDGKRYRRIKNR